jgi:hypothetical protein
MNYVQVKEGLFWNEPRLQAVRNGEFLCNPGLQAAREVASSIIFKSRLWLGLRIA